MKILVIDSLPQDNDVEKVSFTTVPPSQDYIDHSQHTLSVFKETLPEAELVFCNIAYNQCDGTYYSCLENHKNFNKALMWAKKQKFDAVYAQVQFYCRLGANASSVRKHRLAQKLTSECIKELGIPIVCPAENSESETVEGVEFSPSMEEAEYVCSRGYKRKNATLVTSRKYRYTSELAVVRLKQLLSPSRGSRRSWL